MKKILMLTDFSKSADHAAKTVAKVSPQLKADILLYNTYYDHPILLNYAGDPYIVEEFVLRKNESTAKLSQLAVQLRQIIALLNNLRKENVSGLLALVHHRDGFFSGLFDESTTAAALDNQHLPLMAIPSSQTDAG
ncbi:hypothetical protein [Mucilaginibacter terrenus]|nr:hypothetical protein [Mucilaginibacter terrenus]